MPAAAASNETPPASSPSAVTSATLWYQSLRGLPRKRSFAFPWIRSNVHLTSAAVNGLPSCHLTPWRSLNVNSLPSSLHSQLSARSGTYRIQAVLRDVLVENDEVVHHAHHRDDNRVGRLLVDRHAGRAVPVLDFEDPAVFLRRRRPGDGNRRDRGTGKTGAQTSLHRLSSRSAGALRADNGIARRSLPGQNTAKSVPVMRALV